MPSDHIAAPVVLCIDDDTAHLARLTEQLAADGYAVTTATTGKAVDAALAEALPHVIVTELHLPDIDGVELIRRLAAWPGCPVLAVGCEYADQRIVDALDAGARDYVTKPFSWPVLAARLRAALRDGGSARGTAAGDVCTAGAVVLDAGAHELRVAGAAVHLHARGFAVLEMLMRNTGELLPYGVLVGKRRGEAVAHSETQALRIVVSRIRKALGTGPDRPRIVTQARVGYRLVAPDR